MRIPIYQVDAFTGRLFGRAVTYMEGQIVTAPPP